MKRSFVLVAAAGLVLAGCGGGDDSQQAATPTFDEETFMQELNEAFPEDGSTPDAEMEEVSTSDPISVECYSHNPCDATYTPEQYVVSDACYGAVDSYGMGPELEDGMTYLQTNGVFEVHSAESGWTMLNDPQIITDDGFTEMVGLSVNCRAGGNDQDWGTTVDTGQKARVYGAWVIPEDTEYMILEGKKIKLPEVDDAAEIDDTAGGE